MHGFVCWIERAVVHNGLLLGCCAGNRLTSMSPCWAGMMLTTCSQLPDYSVGALNAASGSRSMTRSKDRTAGSMLVRDYSQLHIVTMCNPITLIGLSPLNLSATLPRFDDTVCVKQAYVEGSS